MATSALAKDFFPSGEICPKALPADVFCFRSKAHFDELDALWVMHHSRFFKHLERAQQELFNQLMETDAFDPQAYPDIYVVVKNLHIDFLSPLKGVGEFYILLKGMRLREAGSTVGFEFRSLNGALVYARGTRTLCKLGLETHAPAGWSAQYRTRFTAWMEGALPLRSREIL